MSFSSKRSLSKISLISSSIATVLLMAGCDKTTTEPTEPVAIETTTVDADMASSVSKDTSSAVMAKISADSFNKMFFSTLINSGELSAEQTSCLESHEENLGEAEIQAFYKNQFSEAELQELSDFYTSETGKKMIAYSNEQLLEMSGQEVTNPVPKPSIEELAEFQKFMVSPLGVKNLTISESMGEGSLIEGLTPVLDAEFERCKLGITMSQISQLNQQG